MFMVTRLEATIEVTQRCACMVNDRLTIYSFSGGREVSQSSSLLPEPLNGSKAAHRLPWSVRRCALSAGLARHSTSARTSEKIIDMLEVPEIASI